MDTGVRMDAGFRMSSGVPMDSSVRKMLDLNFREDDSMDDSNFGLNSIWLNSMTTPQGHFQAPQFQDPFITLVMEDVLLEKQPGRIKKTGWKVLPPNTQLPPTTIPHQKRSHEKIANPTPMPRMTTPLLGSEFMGAQQQTPSMTHEFQAFYNSPAVERWFVANKVDHSQYKITFCYPHHVPRQNGLYGDCGPLMLSFMSRMMSGYHVELVHNAIVYGWECRELLLEEFFEHRLDWVT
ncbi:hypothetical protein Tco_0490850 [Tanacetum coccineum]